MQLEIIHPEVEEPLIFEGEGLNEINRLIGEWLDSPEGIACHAPALPITTVVGFEFINGCTGKLIFDTRDE